MQSLNTPTTKLVQCVYHITVHLFVVRQRERVWVYQSLIDSLKEDEIAVLNIGPGITRYIGQRDISELFSPGGHYNEEGYEVVANLVYDHLRSKDLVP